MTPARRSVSIADELTTARTVIRPYQPSDAEALYQTIAASREHIAQWLPWAHEHTGPDYTRDLIGHFQEQWRAGEDFTYGVFDHASGALLGGLGLHPHDWEVPSFEIGYWLAADAEGHGYMTEAATALVDYALSELAARRVEIRCNARNTRSAAVARRLGFTQEGLLHNHMRLPDGVLRDTLIFARWVE
ncbi:MAG TPA: GNAT family N-acetyltransferase [Ktedonobacterales bacterium]|jgi:RimJ/RimL family protein N-acetyltransferase|nr:GNAT family N-acetyltransferase [Ktedonobacterales bacterium]